jgi:phospholysine phosphohistidine inorganic pyrophosphate phosphatase
MNAILFDLDGVVYLGDSPIPGARDALEWVKGQGIPHRFVTNTTSRPRAAVGEKLRGMGIEVEDALILTPPVAACEWLRRQGAQRLALFTAPTIRGEFAGFEALPETAEDGADAVILGDMGEAWDFQRLNRAFRLLMAEPRPHLVALGTTRYWRAEDGLRLDTGPFVAALREASGATPVVLGKPSAAFFDAALDMLDSLAAETWMIGDDIRGDVHGAQEAGLKGVLVRTGKFRPDDLRLGALPDGVIPSIADLPNWWPVIQAAQTGGKRRR